MKKNLRTFLITAASIAISYLALIFLFQAGIISNYYQGIIIAACINIILAVSLNLTTGCLGELVLGHAGFMSIGAYASALFTLNMDLPMAVEFPISLLLGGIVAGLCGMLIGIPALRLRGDYLAIITLGFGEIIRVLILNLKFTGGGRGLSGIPEYTSFNWVFFIMVATIILMFTLIFSRHGRSILAIRDNLIAAEAVGVNTTFYKIYAFTISSFFAGVAGGLYAHYITVLDPTTFGFMRSVEILIMVVLGGMGSFTGSVLAAGFLTLLPELLRSLNDYRLLIYSIALVVMMIFRPEGLLGKKELPDLFRKKAPKGGEAHE